MGEPDDARRHPIRSLIKLAIVAGIIYGVGRLLIQTKERYADLTESEARRLLQEKLGPRIGEETAVEIADQVIPKLRRRGLVRADMTTEAPAESPVETQTTGETEQG